MNIDPQDYIFVAGIAYVIHLILLFIIIKLATKSDAAEKQHRQQITLLAEIARKHGVDENKIAEIIK